MKHEFFFYAGLPRSGGTMLASLLNQHPGIYCSTLSPIVELLHYNTKYFFEKSEAFAASPNLPGALNVLKSIPRQFYANVSKKYIIDNNRAWPNNIDMIKDYITEQPRIICIVRDVVEILASFINLIEKSGSTGKNFVDRWLLNQALPLNTETRCRYLMQPIGIVNQSLWALLQAFEKNQQQYLHIVEYRDLIKDPITTLNKIIEFLDIDHYQFDFENIVNVIPIDDTIYNLEGMHSVRRKLASANLDTRSILGTKLYNKYQNLEFWRQYQRPTKVFSL